MFGLFSVNKALSENFAHNCEQYNCFIFISNQLARWIMSILYKIDSHTENILPEILCGCVTVLLFKLHMYKKYISTCF